MKYPSIDEAWATYLSRVVPGNAPSDQVREVRRAFYAGAQGLYGIVTEQLSAMPDDDGVKALAKLGAELRAFGARVGVDR